MKTSQVKYYYESYKDEVRRHGYRCLSDCYKNPSQRKKDAEKCIAMEVYKNGGYGYTVISYNIDRFACGYLYQHNGDTYFVVHVAKGRGVMLIEED